MRGKKAKELRRKVFGDYAHSNKNLRRVYRALKKEYKWKKRKGLIAS